MRRPRRSSVVLVAGFVLAIAVVVVLEGERRSGARLHPANPGPDGARAVARVLADQGVSVQVATGAEALEAAGPDAATTVLVTSPQELGPGTAEHLVRTAGRSTVVVAGPGIAATEALGLGAPPEPTEASGIEAGCRSHGLTPGLEIAVDRAQAHVRADAPGEGCFATDEGHLLAGTGDGLTLLGAADLLQNEQVTRADNAAVALRLLGQHERLVWYVPRLDDLGAGDRVDVRTLLPPWLGPALGLLALAVLTLMVARGRRLGPLEVEPLPVMVRAVETTRARGRLYRRAGDRAHTARTLRRATLRRTTARLGLPPSTPTGDIVATLARESGRDDAELRRILDPEAPAPTTDEELIGLAQDLAALEEEVATR